MRISESCGKKGMFPYASNVPDGDRESFGMAVAIWAKGLAIFRQKPVCCRTFVICLFLPGWVCSHFVRERGCQLRAHAGPGNEHISATLGMTRGQADRPAARIVQTQYGLYGKLGREDGLSCGQALSGIKDFHLDRSLRTPDGRFACRNAGYSRVRVFRE